MLPQRRDCTHCLPSPDAIWSDGVLQVVVSGPVGLPFVARVLPCAHLAERDLDAAMRRRINRVLKRIASALADDEEISGFEYDDTGYDATHLAVIAMARPPVGRYAPDTSLAFLDAMLPAVAPDVLEARTARVVAALALPSRFGSADRSVRTRRRRPASHSSRPLTSHGVGPDRVLRQARSG